MVEKASQKTSLNAASGCVSTSPFSDKLSVILTKRTFIKKSKICCLSVNDVIVINRKMVEKSDNMVENGLVETQPEAAFRLVRF